MRCLQHVLWRGAMALSLVAAGLGSGYGLYEAPVRSGQSIQTCPEDAIAQSAVAQSKRIDRSNERVLVRVSMLRG